jgi:hypothetical protein
MARVALEVPVGLVACIRDTTLLLYRAAVEALHLALGAHGEAGSTLGEVRRHRARLTELGRMLDQVGWPGEPVPHGELAGSRDVLRDVLHGSLIDAGERLAVACDAGWRGEASADGVRSAAGEVIALDLLLRQLEASERR